MGGYGVALCAAGLLSIFPIAIPFGAVLVSDRASSEPVNDGSRAILRFPGILAAGGAFLVLLVLVRLFVERAGISKAGIDITSPYPLIGLVVGGIMPVILRSLLQPSQTLIVGTERRARRDLHSVIDTLGIWLLAAAVPLLVAYFWRTEAVGALLSGLAAASIFLILTLWLGEARDHADGDMASSTASANMISIGSALTAVLCSPQLIELTGTITRAGDDVILTLKPNRVADPRCMQFYKSNMRLKRVKK
jgi:hypothetical protein